MSHGQPDYGMYTLAKTIYRLSDMGELAVRLESIVSFDRRGDVVWTESFEYGITNWFITKSDGETITRTTDEALSGSYSVELQCQANPTTSVGIVRRAPLPVNSRMGVEVAFLPDANARDFRVDMVLYDGTNLYLGYTYIEMSSGIIYYRNSSGNWAQLATGVTLRQDGYCWHHYKLVVDLEEAEYVRLIMDNTTYSMAGLGLQYTANTSAPTLELTIKQINNNQASVVYVDDVILTQNEP